MGRQDRGFSMVELIVVTAIMAVLSVAAVSGIGMVSGWKLNQSVKRLESALDETKINAMSREACILEISKDAAGDYYIKMTGAEDEKLADDRISISYLRDDAAVEYPLEESQPLRLSYQRSSGAFSPLILTWQVDESASAGKRYTYSYQTTGSGGNYSYCSGIIVRMGTRETVIRLVKDTGRHYIG